MKAPSGNLSTISAIDRRHRHPPALAAGKNRLADRVGAISAEKGRSLDLVDDVIDVEAVCFQPDGIDHRIWANSAGRLQQRVIDVRFAQN